ncbi:MAG TPA: hypothetical protein VF173_07240 [Thermoanaerobaculia bacterium]|nr:hypothetical protein [Thermoanaerobaculia bacterium]
MPQNPTRVIAIDPIAKGFGFVIFEQPFHLVAWGIARVKGDKRAGAIVQFEKLLAEFRPDAVVLEDAAAPGSRRRHRVRDLIKELLTLAGRRNLVVHTFARSAVIERFSSPEKRATKYSIATRLTRDFPELGEKLPPPRKPWDSEHERMSVFDALALAVTYVTE